MAHGAVDGASDLVRPHFLVVARSVNPDAQLLRTCLKAQPGVYVPGNTEPSFFGLTNPPIPRASHTPVDAARGRIRGEFAPVARPIEPWRLRIAKQLIPEVRLLLLAANPVETAWRQALALSGGGPEQLTPGALDHYINTTPELRPGALSRMIQDWTAVFSDAQTLTILHDDLLRSSRRTFAAITHHLGAPVAAPDPLWSATAPIPIPADHRLVLRDHYGSEVRLLARVLGGRAEAWIERL